MRILAFDLETAPTLAYTWSTFKANIGYNQIIEPGRIICASYKWIGDDEVQFVSEFHDGREEMILKLWELVDEAQVLLGYNNSGFDNKWLNSEFISYGMQPPSPYQTIDLYQTIKQNTQFPSKKLAYVAPSLIEDTKVSHTGFDLWIGCLNGDPESWEIMREYAIKDTELLEPLYLKLRPWIKNHPNTGLYSGDDFCCPACGSADIQYRGYTFSGASKFRRIRCKDCGKWSRTAQRVETTGLRNA